MKNIIQKSVSLLTETERNQISTIIKRYYPSAQNAYIEARVKKEQGFDIVMTKEDDKILGVSYYSLVKENTPFDKKPIIIVQFGQAMKVQGYKGNIIWQLGRWYANRNIGYHFPLIKAAGISAIVSPKVYENFVKLYPHTYPNPINPSNETIISFLNTYYHKYRDIDIEVDSDCCYNYSTIEIDDITNDWQRVYKAKDERINQFFIDKGIIKFENGKIYKGAKHLMVCGYRNPTLWLSKIKNSFKRLFTPAVA